ncbi:hypothetical protein B0T12DRAFT_412279 [Alternaria alternata]|nr:hypothetical protein B0T12DRAFT_412279 [Alternaria alternata]
MLGYSTFFASSFPCILNMLRQISRYLCVTARCCWAGTRTHAHIHCHSHRATTTATITSILPSLNCVQYPTLQGRMH